MLANNFSSCTSTCFAIFELIKFMCFGSTLSYPQKEFLNPRPAGLPGSHKQKRPDQRFKKAK